MRYRVRLLAITAACAGAIAAGLLTTTASATSPGIDVGARAHRPDANTALAGHTVLVGVGAESYSAVQTFGVHLAVTLLPNLTVLGPAFPEPRWSCTWVANTASCDYVGDGGAFPGPASVHVFYLRVQLPNVVGTGSVTTAVTHSSPDPTPENDVATATFAIFGGAQTVSRPPLFTTLQEATFEWRVGPRGSRTECSLDNAPYQPCSSPRTYRGLAAGFHQLSVRALDTGDPSPYSVYETWNIGGPGAPDTLFDATPPASTSLRLAPFAWHSDQAGSRFQCSLDGAPFAPCSSPQTYRGLALGTHTLAVRAGNFAGQIDPTPASHTWTIVP